MDKYMVFKNVISEYGSDDVKKEKLLGYAHEIGIDLPKRISYANLVNIIFEFDKKKFFQDFHTKIYVPEWILKDYWGLTTKDFENLKNVGFFTDIGIKSITKEFYQRSRKEYAEFLIYHGSVLDIYPNDVKKIIRECSGSFPIRINTVTESETTELIQYLSTIFEITTSPRSYEKRDNQGYYTYFSVHPISEHKYEKNRYLKEIQELKEEIDEIKKSRNSYMNDSERLETILKYCFKKMGIDHFTILQFFRKIWDNEKTNKLLEDVDKLFKDIENKEDKEK